MTRTALTIGHATLDRFGDALRPGGSVTYTARVWSALGARARVLTACAEDFPVGDALVDVEVHALPSPATTTFTNHYPPDGPREMRLDALASPLTPDALPAPWRAPDLAILAPVMGELELGAWAAHLQTPWLGLGLQGCLRAADARGRVTRRPAALEPALLRRAALVCLSREDIGEDADIVELLEAHAPRVIVTEAERGCVIFEGGRRRRVGVYPTTAVVDPSGAGDAFAAATLLALARGEDTLDAARWGAAAASVVIEGVATDTLDRVHEAHARIASVPSKGRRLL